MATEPPRTNMRRAWPVTGVRERRELMIPKRQRDIKDKATEVQRFRGAEKTT